jgi:hypothetical protein
MAYSGGEEDQAAVEFLRNEANLPTWIAVCLPKSIEKGAAK